MGRGVASHHYSLIMYIHGFAVNNIAEVYIMEILINCLKAFLVGGGICLIGQILIDYTKLTPARILTSFVVVIGISAEISLLFAPYPVQHTVTEEVLKIFISSDFS